MSDERLISQDNVDRLYSLFYGFSQTEEKLIKAQDRGMVRGYAKALFDNGMMSRSEYVWTLNTSLGLPAGDVGRLW